MVSIESILAPWCILERGEVEKARQMPWPELYSLHRNLEGYGRGFWAYEYWWRRFHFCCSKVYCSSAWKMMVVFFSSYITNNNAGCVW